MSSAPRDNAAPPDSPAPQGTDAARDLVGMWYLARLHAGIDDGIWLGFAEQDGPLSWRRVPHRGADGMGALYGLLQERGYRGGDLPCCRETRAPGLGELLARARRHPVAARPGAPRWRHADTDAIAAGDQPPAACFLSTTERAALRAAAAAEGVSENHWLLWCLDRATRYVLAGESGTHPWVFPVNLRGAVRQGDARMNHCSGVLLRLDGSDDAAAAQAQARARLSAGEHWRTWQWLTLGRWVGQPGINLLYRLAAPAAGRHAGSWSHLGSWPLPGMQAPDGCRLAGVAVTAPGSPAYPVSGGVVEWRGRLSLAVRVHPLLAGRGPAALQLLEHWRQRALYPY